MSRADLMCFLGLRLLILLLVPFIFLDKYRMSLFYKYKFKIILSLSWCFVKTHSLRAYFHNFVNISSQHGLLDKITEFCNMDTEQSQYYTSMTA